MLNKIKKILREMISTLSTPGDHTTVRPLIRDKKISYERRLRERKKQRR